MRRAAEWTVLGLVIVASVWLWRTPGSSDVEIWTTWLHSAVQLGLRGGYAATAHDYPPGSTTLLWIAGRLGGAAGASVHGILKALVSCFLLATTGVALAWTRRPLFAALTCASLTIGAIGLVYLDVLAAPFLLAAVWAASRERRGLGLVLLTIACAIKWQPIMAAPFVLVYACATRRDGTSIWRAIIRFGAVTGVIAAALLLYFGPVVISAFYHAAGHHHLSAQGLNLGWILTWVLHVVNPAGFGPIVGGQSEIIVPRHSVWGALQKAAFGLSYLWILVGYARSRDRSVTGLLRSALAAYLVYFLFNSGVHENHLQIAVVFALALAAIDRAWVWVVLVLAVCSNLNLIAFYGIDGPFRVRVVSGIDLTVWLAVVVTAALAYVTWMLAPNTSRVDGPLPGGPRTPGRI